MPTKKENIQRNAKIVAAIKNGKTNNEIAEMYALTREHIRQIGIKGGLMAVNNQKKARNIKIIKDFKKGIMFEELSLKYNLSYSILNEILGANGLPSEFKTRRTLRNKKIIEMFHQGLSCRKITSLFNLHYVTVLAVLNRQGLYYRISPEKATIRNNKIILDAKNGKRSSEISKKHSISAKRIQQIVSGAGFFYRKMLKVRNEKIMQEFKKGVTKKKLALKYKLGVYRIGTILRKS